MDAVVTQLHRALADAIVRTRPLDARQPVSVAEIYQELVPYREVRGVIGVDMNADYEYALLRLLAGEGGFARLEPAEAREALRLEIGSPNPNVTLYRKFAACDVWVDLPQAEPEQVVTRAAEPPQPRLTFTFTEQREPEGEYQPAAPVAEFAAADDEAQCVACSRALPAGRNVNFCPFCGADQRVPRCAACGEILDRGWRFCAACGASVAPGAGAA